MRSKYDLHVHTNISDGEYSPGEVIQRARDRGLEIIAITDHGKIDGVKEVMKNFPRDITVIPGIEFTASISNEFFHILGYFKEVPELNFNFGREMEFEREKRLYWYLINRLGRGIHIWKEEIIQAKGILSEINENNGLGVLAHPSGLNLSKRNLDKLVKRLKRFGLKGIEVFNAKHPEGDFKYYSRLADKYNLLKTSGTDYHGYFNPIGTNMMSQELMEAFLEELNF